VLLVLSQEEFHVLDVDAFLLPIMEYFSDDMNVSDCDFLSIVLKVIKIFNLKGYHRTKIVQGRLKWKIIDHCIGFVRHRLVKQGWESFEGGLPEWWILRG